MSVLQTALPSPEVLKGDLSGRTVVVTGANTGIGLEAAKHFASMNPARLIMACRNKEKGETGLKAVEAATGYNKAELWLLDLSSFASVLAFFDKFEQDGGKIDIFVANAGVCWSHYVRTVDGWEETIQVNHISTALVSILALPYLLRAASNQYCPRLCHVTSGAHFWIKDIDSKDLATNNVLETWSDENYPAKEFLWRYALTKLFNVFFTRALASRLQSSSMIVNCPDPGYCTSELTRNITIVIETIETLIPRTSEEGSRNLIWAAMGGKGREEELRGAFIRHCDVGAVSSLVSGEGGEELQDRIWKDTMEVLTKISPKVAKILEELD